MSQSLGLSCAAVVLLALTGCGSRDHGTQAALSRYFDAVQSGDHEGIAQRLMDCVPPADCSEEILALDASVQAQRVLERYKFDDDWGFGLIGALSLGRGAYWTIQDSAVSEEDGTIRADLVLRVSTGYARSRTRDLPEGTRIEYLVRPLGAVRVLVRGEKTQAALRDELRSLDISARLALSKGEGGEEVWRIVHLRPIEDTAVYKTVTWRPE